METLTAQQEYILDLLKKEPQELNPRVILSIVQNETTGNINPFPKSSMINDVRDTILDLEWLGLVSFTAEGVRLT